MTPSFFEKWKDYWEVICNSILAVLGILGITLQYWELAGPAVTYIWERVWPVMVLYAGYRVCRFGWSFYRDSKESQQQVAALQAEVRAWFKEERQSRRSGDEAITTDVGAKLKPIYGSLEKLINEREALEKKITELNQDISKLKRDVVDLVLSSSEPPKKETTIAEMLFKADKTPKQKPGILQVAAPVPSLLDFSPHGGMLSKGAKPPKGTNNGG